ncbi:hypothetical protein B0H17DRAFT_1135168 [Mycena rosella]|uniref:Uncharacterized protein n=1 Tax=Mycena rosella TaxID=1033263 RepID=A0AAD7DE13_MYCRO|nr:hypothetical protein B0H17DRAFT_1135168 [Mycena rosella]
MFNTFAVLLATDAVANAVSSSNPYIPDDISTGCLSYLETLNDNTSLSACTSALTTASSGFRPGGNSTSASKATITSALTSLCSTSTTSTCSQSPITGKLAAFYTVCSTELTSTPSTQVKTIYNMMTNAAPSSAAANLAPVLAMSKTVVHCVDTVTAYMPNATTINSKNFLFLFLDGSLPQAELCTSCTRNILTSYISFEANINYAPGLLQSVLMSGQPALYAGIMGTCGADILTNVVKAAEGLRQGTGSGLSGALPLRPAGAVLAMLIGVAFLL